VNLNNNNKNSINIIKNRAHSVIGADTDSGTASAKLITTGKPQRIKTRVAVIGAGTDWMLPFWKRRPMLDGEQPKPTADTFTPDTPAMKVPCACQRAGLGSFFF
jgi:hypothetical protein